MSLINPLRHPFPLHPHYYVLIHPPLRMLYHKINLLNSRILRDPIAYILHNAPTTRWTIWLMLRPIVVRDETDPAEVVAASIARHVIAAAVLLDVDAALGALFGAHGADLFDGGGVFGGGGR